MRLYVSINYTNNEIVINYNLILSCKSYCHYFFINVKKWHNVRKRHKHDENTFIFIRKHIDFNDTSSLSSLLLHFFYFDLNFIAVSLTINIYPCVR